MYQQKIKLTKKSLFAPLAMSVVLIGNAMNIEVGIIGGLFIVQIIIYMAILSTLKRNSRVAIYRFSIIMFLVFLTSFVSINMLFPDEVLLDVKIIVGYLVIFHLYPIISTYCFLLIKYCNRKRECYKNVIDDYH